MKISYRWLTEWIKVPWEAKELGARLTMAGFELEGIETLERGNDYILDLAISPNRGDAMSIRGVAREVAALCGQALGAQTVSAVPAQVPDTVPVRLSASSACPKFAGRVIRGIDGRAQTPAWMRKRLESCAIRSINPIVDVTNYTMLELGTPMHAYDMAKLQGDIDVRFAKPGERVQLLDGQEVELATQSATNVLVIADAAGPVGLAGVMGGERTAVTEATVDIFFEVAFFAPEVIGTCSRRYGLLTDAAQRFERGVDPQAQEQAIERATQLLVEIAGGSPGPAIVTEEPDHLPRRPPIHLRQAQLARLIGLDVPRERVENILESLGMRLSAAERGWMVDVPGHRFDVSIEADLVEEVARIFGYDEVPEVDAQITQTVDAVPEAQLSARRAVQILVDRGYQEAITYTFVDPRRQTLLFPDVAQLSLSNPISADMSAMRVSLWPGLLQALGDNLRRQQDRVRLIEYGRKFQLTADQVTEISTLAGVACGHVLAEQWGEKPRLVDFFDLKGDLHAVLEATGCAEEFAFQAGDLPCLHPGRTARILRDGVAIGWLGELHPETVKALDLTYPALLFELETAAAFRGKRPAFVEISKYPVIRRDLAIVVAEQVPLAIIEEEVRAAAGELLRELRVFDIYRGPFSGGVDSGRKSVALGLILQESSRTLADADADRIVGAVVERLRRELDASIRDQ